MVKFRLCGLLCIVWLIGSALPARAQGPRAETPLRGAVPGRVALTFDDLPALTILPDQAYVDYLTVMILRGLKRHHFPAIGFVNESKLDELDRRRQTADLRRWLDAGMDLGNHTFSHDAPDEHGARAYTRDIARGAVVTGALLARHHKAMRYFRHPYLKTGYPLADKRFIEAWLARHGYRIAPVTLNADDWEFAEPYDDAIARHDTARQAHIRAEYLAHTQAMILWSRSASQVLFHRDIPYVILLHATRLNADAFDDLAALLARNRLKPVSLDRALADPAYLTHDPYVGPQGLDWMERWALQLHRTLPEESDPPRDIQEAYDRVDDDRCLGQAAHCDDTTAAAPARRR